MRNKIIKITSIIFAIIILILVTMIAIYFIKNKDMIRLELYLETNGYKVTDVTLEYKNTNIAVAKNITTEDGNIMSYIYLFENEESAKENFEHWVAEEFEEAWWVEDKSTLYENCYSVSESGVEKYNIGGNPILILNGKYVFYGNYENDYDELIDLCEKINNLEQE